MPLGLFSTQDRRRAEAIGALAFCNPFLPERVELERRLLGSTFVAIAPVWSADPRLLSDNVNVAAIRRLAEELATTARRRAMEGARALPEEWGTYDELVLHVLFYRYEDVVFRELAATPAGASGGSDRVPYYPAFRDDVQFFFEIPGSPLGELGAPHRVFALLHQFRRAFHFTFRRILGNSLAAAGLRAAVWQSVFTRDLRRYRRQLFDRMQDVSTLIVGPSGTGKDLVAQAIGLSRFIPFDDKTMRFAQDLWSSFRPISAAALPSELVESELFGHRKGAFTGAIGDREGHLDGCGPWHTVFLDEIGEVEPSIQVKLLRVLQSRVFQRVGDSTPRRFEGKLVAAPNRDLAVEVAGGHFREDLYYRLCADVVATPTLADQVAGDPDELHRLVLFATHRIVGQDQAGDVADEVTAWIERHLTLAYPWPGNIRELEQCVRSILVHGDYRPIAARRQSASVAVVATGRGGQPDRHSGTAPSTHAPLPGGGDPLAKTLESSGLSAEELVTLYCATVYERTRSYCETGRLLGLDRRTVAARVALDRRRRGSPSARRPGTRRRGKARG